MRGEKAHKSDKMEDRNECNAIPSHNSDPTHDCSALILPSDLTQLVVLPGQGRAASRVLMFYSSAMKPHEIQEKLGLTRLRDRNW